MSTHSLISDTHCSSMGYVGHPKRGYLKSLRTCFPVTIPQECGLIAAMTLTNTSSAQTSGIFNVAYTSTSSLDITLSHTATTQNTSTHRFVTASMQSHFPSSRKVCASFTDSTQTVVRVTFSDINGVSADVQPFVLKVYECSKTSSVPIVSLL